SRMPRPRGWEKPRGTASQTGPGPTGPGHRRTSARIIRAARTAWVTCAPAAASRARAEHASAARWAQPAPPPARRVPSPAPATPTCTRGPRLLYRPPVGPSWRFAMVVASAAVIGVPGAQAVSLSVNAPVQVIAGWMRAAGHYDSGTAEPTF